MLMILEGDCLEKQCRKINWRFIAKELCRQAIHNAIKADIDYSE